MKFFTMKILLLISCFAAISTLYAQTNKCAWLPKNHPHNLNGRSTNREEGFKSLLRSQQNTDADSIYTLPIVIHVIHTGTAIGSADNPDDNHIIAMIDGLNKAWRKNGNDFGGADMKIQFQLAAKSPQCEATNGINRVNGSSIPNYVSGGITNYNNPESAQEVDIKNLSRWPNTDYINIWIVNKINGNAFAPGGYAYFPEYNSALTDGMVLNASVVDGSNKTIVHEMGHIFFLSHTFEGSTETTCSANTDCNTQGDLICDTEPILAEVTCSTATNACTGNPFIIADAVHNYTILNNYMGYTDCQWMFTQDQKTRARWALFSFRHGLISSGALNASPVPSPTAACLPTATYGLSPYYGVQQVDFNTLNVYSNSSQAEGNHYIDRTCNQSTTVVKGQSYTLNVTGSYFNPHRIKAFIDYNNDGDFDDAGETVLSDWQGLATTIVTIPNTGVITNVPLRMRVVADNPELPEPGACQLNGTAIEGAGQVEDYAVVIINREVFSITSGNWNNPATWSCNCIPQGDDQVSIKANHTITITAAMGNLQCGKLSLDATSVFNVSGGLFKVVGND